MNYIPKNNFILKEIKNYILKNKILYINTRFSPDPNGCIHIGHCKSIIINYFLSKKYNGIFNIRFDDTNPNEKNYYYINKIKYDLDWLNIKYDYISYTSDNFEKIYNYSIILIKKKLAYIDKTNFFFKKYKGNFKKIGINNPSIIDDIDENIYLFNKMLNGFYKENEICLRAKINMQSPNLLMRDPVLYRIKYKKHFRTNNNWCIYPTYDFSHCICDYIEKITFSLCTTEFNNNKELYNWVLNSIEVNYNRPIQYEFSKLNIENISLSKRYINNLIKNKIVKNWDDPRLLTISGLRNKGYNNKTILEFCNLVGVTKKNSILKIEYIENIYKKSLNIDSIRIMSIINPILLYITNLKKNILIKYINQNYDKKYFYKYVLLNNKVYVEKYDFLNDDNTIIKNIIGKIIKLRYSFIIKITSFKKINNNFIIYCKYFKNTLNSIFFKNIKVNKIILWVSSTNNYKTKFIFYKNLLVKKNFYYKNNKKNICKNTILIKFGFTEKSNFFFKKKYKYQIERIGYFIIKKIYIKNNFIIFSNILNINKCYLI